MQKSGEKVRIEIKMQKTQEPLYLPIRDNCFKVAAAKMSKGDDLIFLMTHEGDYIKTHQKWGEKMQGLLSISRFMFSLYHATMMLTLGADLYTVANCRGIKNIATTQIYAKIC